jgi:hypothetical protein
MIEDKGIYPLMLELSSCLCAKLEEADAGPLCFCGVVPGEVAYVDANGCGGAKPCGSAWVRLANAYPSDTFPGPAEVARCGTTMAYVVELGVVRCRKVMDSQGRLPSVSELEAQTAAQLSDMAAMLRALQCCDALGERTYGIGDYTPTPSEGGVGGGAWTVTIWEQ